MWKISSPSNGKRDLRVFVASCTGAVVAYCVIVLWHVATVPDIGLRCLLPEASDLKSVKEKKSTDPETGIEIWQFVQSADPAPRPGDRLISLNGEKIGTFLDFVLAMQRLRSAKIPSGGLLAPGSEPLELRVPPLVEVFNSDPSKPPERLVKFEYTRPNSARPDLVQGAYVPVLPVNIFEISLTIFWFVCQLTILAIALTSYWYRPYDRVAQNFCLMCCVSMGAFVPGFHWWMLAGNPFLNIPFIFCAAMLPSVVLNFFLVFPKEPDFLRDRRSLIYSFMFGTAGLICAALIVTYWASWALSGSGHLNVFQKMSYLTQMLLRGVEVPVDPLVQCTILLLSLRVMVQFAIVVASIYFALTVVRLGLSLARPDSPRERRQVVAILGAALLSTIPISYTLYLAFFRQVDFALGKAQIPMFCASMFFMAAYSHGIFRHRLMLAEDSDDKSRRYVMMSILVSGGFAALMALGGVFAHSYSLPLNSSTTQRISLFLILLLASGLTLWVRDRLQAAVDRRFFSEKYQLDRAMQQLNRSAAYLAEPSAMADMTLRTCEDVMDASWAIMYARDGQGVFRLIGSRSASNAPAQLRAEQISGAEPAQTVVERMPSANREAMPPIQQLLYDLRCELVCFMEGEGGIHGL
ncbi:MAG: hypothetical protein ACK58L_05980, partial [Planctomycetota bacterium]